MLDIRHYRQNIKLLDGYADGRFTLKGKNYSDLANNYRRTKGDHQRYILTRKNLDLQVMLLEKELQTLIQYCS